MFGINLTHDIVADDAERDEKSVAHGRVSRGLYLRSLLERNLGHIYLLSFLKGGPSPSLSSRRPSTSTARWADAEFDDEAEGNGSEDEDSAGGGDFEPAAEARELFQAAYNAALEEREEMSFQAAYNPEIFTSECRICGCSKPVDESGDRVCFCDTCATHGCTTAAGWYSPSIGRMNSEMSRVLALQYGPSDRARDWNHENPYHLENKIYQPHCERCGCNRLTEMEFDESDGRLRFSRERNCFCDTCKVSGCSWEDAASWPQPVCCMICEDAHPDIAAIEANTAEQWGNKRVCDHKFCGDCLGGWIGACIADGNPHIRCPATDCTCTLLPDDVQRIAPAHVKQLHVLLNRDFSSRASEVADDPELLAAFRQFAQQCPQCSLWVGRSEGCNSMVCLCGCTFCYQCGGDRCDGTCDSRDDSPEGLGNALYGEYLAPTCIDCNREMRREWVPPGHDRPARLRCFDCSFANDIAAMNMPRGCLVCGCASEVDAVTAERVCFCDPCRSGGCVFEPDEDDGARVVLLDRAEYALRRVDECVTCGCSAEVDAATGERICFCDPCRSGGCIFAEHAGEESPSTEEGIDASIQHRRRPAGLGSSW